MIEVVCSTFFDLLGIGMQTRGVCLGQYVLYIANILRLGTKLKSKEDGKGMEGSLSHWNAGTEINTLASMYYWTARTGGVLSGLPS